MPHYVWKGIDLGARVKRGTQFAADVADLEKILYNRDIALTQARAKRINQWKPVTRRHQIEFCRQLLQLIKSGMSIPAALLIVCHQFSYHPRFQNIIHTVAICVQQGVALHEALSDHAIFCPFVIQALSVGHDGGTMQNALYYLCQYLESVESFSKKIRGALYMPIFTLVSCTLMMAVMLGFVVPRFAHFFHSLQHEIPSITKRMLYISELVTLKNVSIIMSIIVICTLFIRYIMRNTGRGVLMYDWFLLHMPIIRTILRYHIVAQIAHTLMLLLRSGMPVVPALQAVTSIIRHSYWQQILHDMYIRVSAGSSLATAMKSASDGYWPEDVIAVVNIGQESGSLDQALESIWVLYNDKREHVFSVMTKCVQPLFLIGLGIVVMFFVLALYVPIMHMSRIL